MPSPQDGAFTQVWPRCFVIFLSVIMCLGALVLIATELGNVAANFWRTNVFAGGWAGIIMLIEFLAVAVSGCCSPTKSAAFRAVIVTFIALVACATQISFDAVFIAQSSTCILTPSCASNADSTTLFSYYFKQSFFLLFNNLGPFRSYNESQAKFLFQTIQLGVGCLCFVLCLIYLIIYYVTKSKAGKRVGPGQARPDYPAPQPSYQQPPPQRQYQPQPTYRPPPPRQPQAYPGEVPWNANGRRY